MTIPDKDQLTCLECINNIFSPSQGVFCRVWGEIVPLTFSQECPAWEHR
jgi:hypothetical protein